MSRYVVLRFEVDESDASTDEEIEQQIEDVIRDTVTFPGSWTWDGGVVIDD